MEKVKLFAKMWKEIFKKTQIRKQDTVVIWNPPESPSACPAGRRRCWTWAWCQSCQSSCCWWCPWRCPWRRGGRCPAAGGSARRARAPGPCASAPCGSARPLPCAAAGPCTRPGRVMIALGSFFKSLDHFWEYLLLWINVFFYNLNGFMFNIWPNQVQVHQHHVNNMKISKIYN